jgi:hypothetical protein
MNATALDAYKQVIYLNDTIQARLYDRQPYRSDQYVDNEYKCPKNIYRDLYSFQ